MGTAREYIPCIQPVLSNLSCIAENDCHISTAQVIQFE